MTRIQSVRLGLRSLVLALPLAFAACGGSDVDAHGPGDGHDHSAETGAAAAAALHCPPCGMEMPADHELTEVAGMKFACCSPTCVEKVTADPEKYVKFAVN